jgi:hypothetical protein
VARLGIGQLPTALIAWSRNAVEVLRWMLLFAVALILIAGAITWMSGRPLPLPNF